MASTRYFAAALALSASLVLAACGSGASKTANETSQPETAPIEDAAAITPEEGSAPAAEATTAMTSPVATPKDPIRGKGGMVDKCIARVAAQTGAKVEGLNRMDESEAAIEVYVNVEGAEAPWKCHGYSDGSIDEVMYTGSEGAL